MSADKRKETAKRLMEAMSEKGIGHTELSILSGISKSSISQYVHAIHSPSIQVASALAEVLGVRAEWLMAADDEKYADSNLARLELIYMRLPEEAKGELFRYANYMAGVYLS